MRTTVILPDELVKEVNIATGLKTKTQAVNYALFDWLKRIRKDKLKSLKGKLDIEIDLKSMRSLDKVEPGDV